jgi:hypothetical protein
VQQTPLGHQQEKKASIDEFKCWILTSGKLGKSGNFIE